MTRRIFMIIGVDIIYASCTYCMITYPHFISSALWPNITSIGLDVNQALRRHHAMPSTGDSITYFTHMVPGRMCVPANQVLFQPSLPPQYIIDYSPQCAFPIYIPLWPCCPLPQLSQCSSPRAPSGSAVIRNGARFPAPVLSRTCFAIQSPVRRRHLWALFLRPSGCISNQPIPVVLQQPHRHLGSTSACDFGPGARAHICIFL